MKITRLFTINNAVARLTCPNKQWKESDEGQCVPIESSYALSCLASYFKLRIARDLFNMEGEVKVGECIKTIEYGDDDYAVISMSYDERSEESGHLCHVSPHHLRTLNPNRYSI